MRSSVSKESAGSEWKMQPKSTSKEEDLKQKEIKITSKPGSLRDKEKAGRITKDFFRAEKGKAEKAGKADKAASFKTADSHQRAKSSGSGFTIVELVIVIAVIGVLTAVMIPVFSGLVKRAESAAKKAELRDANMVMAMILQSEDHSESIFEDGIITMSEAVNAYSENGYETEAEELIWDISDNRFIFADNEETEISPGDTVDGAFPRYWKAVKVEEAAEGAAEAAAEEGYGVMLMTDGEVGNDGFGGEITVSYSIDTGNCKGLERIVYENSPDRPQTVMLITGEGQCLTIDAQKDTVYHYNAAEKVTVESVDSHSYHEFGRVKELIINDGHIVAESCGKISTVIADVKNKEQKVSIELKGGTITELQVTHENKEFVEFPENVSSKTILSVENPVEYTEPDGTEDAPFEISDFSELMEVVNKANRMGEKDPTIFCKLTENFTLEITEETREYIKLVGNASLSLDFNGHSLVADLTFWLDDKAELILDDSKKSEMRADNSRFNLSLGDNTATGYYFELHGNSKLTVNYIKCDWALYLFDWRSYYTSVEINDCTLPDIEENILILRNLCEDIGSLEIEKIRLKILGGEFAKYDPSAIVIDADTQRFKNCLPMGYAVTFVNGFYKVIKSE